MVDFALVRQLVLLIGSVLFAVSDVRKGKIPNAMILCMVAAGILLSLQSVSSLGWCLLGGAVGFAIGFVLWLLHMFKAGDAKMFWVVGLFAGWPLVLRHLVVIVLAGGVMALVLMLIWGELGERMHRLHLYFNMQVLKRKAAPYTPKEKDARRFPFAVAVLAGEVICTVWLFFGRQG